MYCNLIIYDDDKAELKFRVKIRKKLNYMI